MSIAGKFIAREPSGPHVRADPDIVEDDDVGPFDLRFPVVGLRDEPVADLPVALGLDVVLHGVALAVDLPRQVGDQRRVGRDEEEVRGVHAASSPGTDLSVGAGRPRWLKR